MVLLLIFFTVAIEALTNTLSIAIVSTATAAGVVNNSLPSLFT